jgi:aminopeptidase-like protein
VVGNDERQFNAPGVRVPMLGYSRALPWGHPHRPYREYHSATDDMRTVHRESLEAAKRTVLAMIEAWDANYYPRNLFKGEVFLSGYDLAVDRNREPGVHRNMLRIMDHIDGTASLVEIAERVGLTFGEVRSFVDRLRAVGLVDASFH